MPNDAMTHPPRPSPVTSHSPWPTHEKTRDKTRHPHPHPVKCQPNPLPSTHSAPWGPTSSHITDMPRKLLAQLDKTLCEIWGGEDGVEKTRQGREQSDAPCWASSVSLCVPSAPFLGPVQFTPDSLQMHPFLLCPRPDLAVTPHLDHLSAAP